MEKPIQPRRLVLYADDDGDDLDFVQHAFFKHPEIELRPFRTAPDLLHSLLHQKRGDSSPCLIILDMNMPGMTGKEALKLIRAYPSFDQIAVVLFTISSAPHDKKFAEYYKAGFFTKPLNHNQMEDIVDKFLDHCNAAIRQ